MTLVPQKEWTLFSHWLIWHGRGDVMREIRIARIVKY